MHDVDDLCDLIARTLAETSAAPPPEIVADTPLLVSGLLDSLTIMALVAAIDREAGVSLPESEVVARNFRTPERLHAAVTRARVEVTP